MHRVGKILELKQWRWVPKKLNVADKATKVTSYVSIETWFQGPEFLLKPENE